MTRPKTLVFWPNPTPNRPLRLTWTRPAAAVSGFVVLSTQNPFPPELAPEIFSGRMADFVAEVRLGPEAVDFATDTGAPYYAVLAIAGDDVWEPVADLKEAAGLHPSAGHASAGHALQSAQATQVATFTRARWTPLPSATKDERVDVWIRSDAPDHDTLTAMLTGAEPADYQLDPAGDGFVDTVTGADFRVHYMAVAVDADGGRRPLRLVTGGFMRLDSPELLDAHAQGRLDALLERVTEQIAIDLQLKSAEGDAIAERLARADDLAPGHPAIAALRTRAARRFADEPG